MESEFFFTKASSGSMAMLAGFLPLGRTGSPRLLQTAHAPLAGSTKYLAEQPHILASEEVGRCSSKPQE